MIQQGHSRQALQLLRRADAESRPMAGVLEQSEGEPLADRPSALTEAQSLLKWGLDRQPRSGLLNDQ
jgi:hypothetical protein